MARGVRSFAPNVIRNLNLEAKPARSRPLRTLNIFPPLRARFWDTFSGAKCILITLFHHSVPVPGNMASHGQAESYYNGGDAQPKQGYPMQSQMQYPPQATHNGYENPTPQYQQPPPPNYGENYQNSRPGPMTGDGKQTFDQTFKLDKPKYNDLWAGILVSPDAALHSIEHD